MMRILLCLIWSSAAFAGCLPVTGDKILGRDLAGVLPGLPESLVVGYAPGPGQKRVISEAELERMAKSSGLTATVAGDVCFEMPVRHIAPEEVLAAMAKVAPGPELVETGAMEGPMGDVEFPLSGLEPANPDGIRMWRGWVRYAGTRRSPLWARVRLAPFAVKRGTAVQVAVECGAARLLLEAIAEADAREGDLVALKNPSSGKVFRARVAGAGRATVMIGGPTL